MPYSLGDGKAETRDYVRARHNRNTTILDVGPGAGAYSQLLRAAGFHLDALEIFEPYVERFRLREQYRRVLIGDVRTAELDGYDVVILGDVLEHLAVSDAQAVIRRLTRHSEVIVSVPWEYEQGPSEGNEHEAHEQPDLTPEVMRERYPELRPIYLGERIGVYVSGRPRPVTEELTVLVLSCRRIGCLRRTVAAAREHFTSVEPDVKTTWVCFDNGSSPADRRELEGMGFDHLLLSSRNLGQGPALNRLIATVETAHFLLLEDDWVLENPDGRRFVRGAAGILRSDPRLGQLKLDAMHFTDFNDRTTYDGPFRVGDTPFFVQNPERPWGGFCCPPAITRTETVREVGPFLESEPFRRWWAESEYSARYSRRFFVAKSPELLLFRHIGDEPSSGWGDGAAA